MAILLVKGRVKTIVSLQLEEENLNPITHLVDTFLLLEEVLDIVLDLFT